MTQRLAGYRLQGSGRGRWHVQKVYRTATDSKRAWHESTLCSGMQPIVRLDSVPLPWDRLHPTAEAALEATTLKPYLLCPRCVDRAPRAKRAEP